MKRILLIFAILLLASPVYSASGVTLSGSAVAGAGGAAAATTYYTSCTGSTATTAAFTTGYPLVSALPAVASVTLTSIGFSLSSAGSATECWVGLYADVPPVGSYTYDRLAYATIASPAAGWNEGAISYAVSAGTTYYVVSACNQNVTGNVYSDGNDSVYTTVAYNSTPLVGFNSPAAYTNCAITRAGY